MSDKEKAGKDLSGMDNEGMGDPFGLYFGVFSLISSFIVNTSPYTNNTTIIDDIAIVSPISDFIFGAVGGCIFSFFITFKDHETT